MMILIIIIILTKDLPFRAGQLWGATTKYRPTYLSTLQKYTHLFLTAVRRPSHACPVREFITPEKI